MKKVYTLALFALAALTAGAQTAYQLADKKVSAVKFSKSQMTPDLKMPAKAPAKIAAQVADVVGDYEISYTVELQGADDYAGEMSVSAGAEENTLVFGFPFVNSSKIYTWNITGSLNPETGEITFSKDQPTGFQGAVCDFERWDPAAAQYVSVSEITATYTGDAVVFDEDDAFGLQASTGGYYTFFDMIIMTKIVDDPNADPNEGWTSVGNATFADPWIIPCFDLNPFDYTWKVELQRNDANGNVYRLVDPYLCQSSLLSSMNESTSKHGYIQFNVSDPDHVTFDIVEAGFASSQLGITKLYCYNTLSWAINYMDYPEDFIIDYFGDTMPYTSFKDGVISFGYVVDEEEGDIYDAMFGIQGDKLGGYNWGVPMVGSITFPANDGSGVESIESNNTPAEFFDVNGLRVANPKAGQLVIRRQGDKVSKVIVK